MIFKLVKDRKKKRVTLFFVFKALAKIYSSYKLSKDIQNIHPISFKMHLQVSDAVLIVKGTFRNHRNGISMKG